jgi:hypothetical protein
MIEVASRPSFGSLLRQWRGRRRLTPHDLGGGEIAVPLRVRSGDAKLAFISTLTTFGTATDVTVSELSLESFFPADSATAEHMCTLASRRLQAPAPTAHRRAGRAPAGLIRDARCPALPTRAGTHDPLGFSATPPLGGVTTGSAVASHGLPRVMRFTG